MVGFVILVLWGGGFGIWASMAPLAGAVVASGSFVATGQNKQIQHLEGGIIGEMLVKEGDLVTARQPLVRLDDTAAKAKLRRLLLRRYRLIAMQARLEAEFHSKDSFEMPGVLARNIGDPEVAAIFSRQENEFKARRARLRDEEQVLRREISGLQESLHGYDAQVTSTRARMVLFDEELKGKRELLDQRLARKTDVLALQRAEASLSGELGALLGRIADSKERIARAEQQIAHLHSAATQRAVEELRTTETELDDVQEQIRAAQDVVERTEVRAPVRGIVVKLHQHTPGGVISPGAVILELLPVNDDLLIEARVNPNEITHVHAGQRALVRHTGFNQRIMPMIEAVVAYVSADAVREQQMAFTKAEPEPRRDSPIFIVRVKLDEKDARAKTENIRPMPGMPADVFIKTGERTFFDYIMKPIVDSFSRAFREH
ncbi:MAG: HlyD family type I secretion periplasmic adaptor subunit [Hyphomicrobium sp.]|uniref:HlyD family type I secretion periplasmic adaptor subunit n=1 Tax=Hyphomicrobium sp. TaxID=82 RepID=UPI0013252A6D|nr:HlyD family type I secretion periplasmic adaptor subunit [Hyphomicrobium sp.]KAB2939591.1 MAG: HlyD family type I secretion periplasmic adaptor subunit [Hyphomicrobium sp.]MBZ0208320.1 HlyD family type I secretion periplasmic adaptor subunit [Hyphomicrobium sp.]